MSLFNKKKLEHKQSAVGKHIGAQSKADSYVYGRQKAKKIAESRKEVASKMRN